MPKALSARIFVALIIVFGFLILGNAVFNAHSLFKARAIVLLALAIVAARLKIKLPGLTGTMSVNLPFILLAAALLGPAEAVIVGFISTFAQSLPRERRKFNLVQLAFNCCAISIAVAAARFIYVSPVVASTIAQPALRLAVAAAGYFLVNTITVSLVISLTEKANVVSVWKEMFQLSFAYLVASAGVAGLALTVGHEITWQVPLALLPVMVGVFGSYRRYFAVTAVVESIQAEPTGAVVGAHV